jgi:hypothetical protein
MAILHELTKSGRWLRKLSFRIYRVRVVVETSPVHSLTAGRGFEWQLPDCASHALFSMKKCQAQARREHEFVLFFSSGRIGDIGVAKIGLPS